VWTEEVRARLALPIAEWWSLYIKEAYFANTSEPYQIKQDIDAALGEIERLSQDLADIVENDEGQRGEVARLSAEVERLRESEAKVAHIALARGEEIVARQAEEERLRNEQTCIDLWLRRRQSVTHESATLRSVQEFMGQAEERVRTLEEALREIVDRLDHADKIGRPVDGLAVAMAHDARMALGDTSPFARAALREEGK
jgi:phage shock protein A